MNPERFARLREILLTVPRLPAADRAPYLEEACAGDDELRREAESLLATDPDALPDVARTGGAAGAIDLPGAAPLATTALPDRIGPFHVRGVLGRGGMGVVYRGEQIEPIRREVAIKRVPPGVDHRSILDRFGAERRTLALMEHPGIARVLDAGEDAAGPYFVMELVRGVPITEFCRSGNVSRRERLLLFLRVCDAVEHAHRKGIIHRDLKPSNVLVTTQAGRPAPKIIDFGIAKAIGGDVPASTLTGEGQLVGTIEYMSPEQAAGRPGDVDTRSDVFSLGVILHELVTGRLPFDTRGKTLLEAVRIIAEEPPRPLADVADGDLETIILKALEKDPERRYGSATTLADDIGRLLDGLPILARPPSTLYHFRKMVSRHRVRFALAGTLLASLVAFAVAMTVMFQAQRQERARADAEAGKAREISRFLQDMISSAGTQGREATLGGILDAAARDIEGKFRDRPEIAAALRATIGSAYTASRSFDEANEQLEASLETRRSLFGDRHPETADTIRRLAHLRTTWSYAPDDLARADSLARLALSIDVEQLPEDDPAITESIRQLARILTARGSREEADSLYRVALDRTREANGPRSAETADLLLARARPLTFLGHREEAEASLREALSIYREIHSGDHQSIVDCMHDLWFILTDATEKKRLRAEMLAMSRRLWGEGSPNLVEPLTIVGTALAEELRAEEGVPLLREAMAIVEATCSPDHVERARACNNLASVLKGQGQLEEAAELYRRAYDIWRERLGPTHVHVMICRANLASALDQLGRDDESWALLEEGLTLASETTGPDSGPAALSHRRMAEFCARRERWEEAESHARAAMAVWDPERNRNTNWMWSATVLARSLRARKRWEEASTVHAEIEAALDAGLVRDRRCIANLRDWAECLVRTGQREEAEGKLREALDVAAVTFGKESEDCTDLERALENLGVH